MNLMLMKKFFNIAAIFNKIMFIEVMRLHSESAIMIEEVLYVAECS